LDTGVRSASPSDSWALVVVGTRLLTAGEVIQLWQTADQTAVGSTSGPSVEFYFDDQDASTTPTTTGTAMLSSSAIEWLCVWQCRPANPVTLVKFSSDSLLFATVGQVRTLSYINFTEVQLSLVSLLTFHQLLLPLLESFRQSQ